MKPEDFDDLVWPTHERYVKDKVRKLGSRVNQLQSPTSLAHRNKLVNQILECVTQEDSEEEEESSFKDLEEASDEEKTPNQVDQVGTVIADTIEVEADEDLEEDKDVEEDEEDDREAKEKEEAERKAKEEEFKAKQEQLESQRKAKADVQRLAKEEEERK